MATRCRNHKLHRTLAAPIGCKEVGRNKIWVLRTYLANSKLWVFVSLKKPFGIVDMIKLTTVGLIFCSSFDVFLS